MPVISVLLLVLCILLQFQHLPISYPTLFCLFWLPFLLFCLFGVLFSKFYLPFCLFYLFCILFWELSAVLWFNLFLNLFSILRLLIYLFHLLWVLFCVFCLPYHVCCLYYILICELWLPFCLFHLFCILVCVFWLPFTLFHLFCFLFSIIMTAVPSVQHAVLRILNAILPVPSEIHLVLCNQQLSCLLNLFCFLFFILLPFHLLCLLGTLFCEFRLPLVCSASCSVRFDCCSVCFKHFPPHLQPFWHIHLFHLFCIHFFRM